MDKLIKAAIKNRTLTFLAVLIIVLLGIQSYLTIPQNEDPKVEVRVVQIITYWPGAAAEDVELYVTKPVEQYISKQDDVSKITSKSMAGASVIYAEISKYIQSTEVKPAFQQIRNYVNDCRGDLPDNVLGPFVNDRFGETTAFVLGIASNTRTNRELQSIAEQMQDRLRVIEGVGDIDIMGDQKEIIFVEGSMQYINSLGITPDVIYNAIKQQNIQIAQPYIHIDGKKILLEVTGPYTAVDQIKETVVYTDNDGRLLRIGDMMGTIKAGYEDPKRTIVRANQKQCVVLTVSMKRGGHIVHWGNKVSKLLEEMKKDLPADVEMLVLNDQPTGVAAAVKNFMSNFWQAVAFVLLVIGIGMGLKNAMVVAIAIPLIIFATIACMKTLLGTELQQMSINALIIALGMLVDNAVVISDNVTRFIDMGYSKEDAAYLGAKELTVALFSATATTLAAFIPLALMPGDTGEYIKDIPNVISICLLISYAVAMFVTPAAAVMFLPSFVQKNKKKKKAGANPVGQLLSKFYFKLIDLILSLKWLALLLIGVIFVLVMLWGSTIPIQFFPEAEKTQFTIDVWLPEGYDLHKTNDTVKILEDELMGLKDKGTIENYVAYVGFGGPRFFIAVSPEAPQENYCQIVVNTADPQKTNEAVDYMSKIVDNIPGSIIQVKKLVTGPPVSAPIELRISGKDIALLRQYADNVKSILQSTPGVTTVIDSFGVDSDKIVAEIDQDKAKILGLTSEDIAVGFYVSFEGYQISRLKAPERQIDIMLRLRDEERKDIDSVKALTFVSSSTGRKHRLDEFAHLSLQKQISKIYRLDQQRTITISAYVSGKLPSEVLETAMPEINAIEMEKGFSMKMGGEEEASSEAFGDLIPLAGLSVLVLLLVLAIQFKSLRIALSIFLTLPMGLVGAVLGLKIMNQPLGFMSALGIIALSGIVVNNAIVMVEFLMERLREGRELNDAIKESGVIRFRPIMLTTVSTLVGLLPLALFGGVLFAPMCWVIIFGLSLSTVLTLIIVPMLFVVLGGEKEARRIIAYENEKDDKMKPEYDPEEYLRKKAEGEAPAV